MSGYISEQLKARAAEEDVYGPEVKAKDFPAGIRKMFGVRGQKDKIGKYGPPLSKVFWVGDHTRLHYKDGISYTLLAHPYNEHAEDRSRFLNAYGLIGSLDGRSSHCPGRTFRWIFRRDAKRPDLVQEYNDPHYCGFNWDQYLCTKPLSPLEWLEREKRAGGYERDWRNMSEADKRAAIRKLVAEDRA